ncbi:putative iron-dependent peroxidase [Paraperlucidibaca baekdonensis]|uniref:Putative iron-dependent peroxidase n=1 Tax=Paraperlucidibaca baekdonensis TaxID=748120 RepID=A0A3E0H1W6_9GAMM|nr:Dyp-type peroxidase [Paraperlucidibaca baekdonensis]REH36856.1 putative iron-dependent peroxidase [Paraperlucidibaca baekdonensis]
MNTPQTGILAVVPDHARYISFQLSDRTALEVTLQAIAAQADGERVVVGIGLSVVEALGQHIPGLLAGPRIDGSLVDIPCQPIALWLWLRGSSRGELLHVERHWVELVAPAFSRQHSIEAFKYDTGRDLTGYEDGTENAEGEEAVAVASVMAPAADALVGSSYVAVQQWLHDFKTFDAMTDAEQDNTVGRHRISNEEFDDAPESAHVKRTEQEAPTPEAHVLRRSMPWSAGNRAGLVFTAFGHSLEAYEVLLTRMSGAHDGIIDGLFGFTKPVNGAYVWCPGMRHGQLDLRALGL